MLTLLRLQPPDQPDQLEGAKYSVLDFKLACRMKPTAAQHAAACVTSPPQSKPMASSACLGLDQSSGIVNKTRSKVTNLDLLNHSMCDTHNEREECAPKKGMLFGRWHSRASRIATGQAVCVCSAAGFLYLSLVTIGWVACMLMQTLDAARRSCTGVLPLGSQPHRPCPRGAS